MSSCAACGAPLDERDGGDRQGRAGLRQDRGSVGMVSAGGA
jgi:hypothetical protein